MIWGGSARKKGDFQHAVDKLSYLGVEYGKKPNVEPVYLSACLVAENKTGLFSDEVISVVSGCQLGVFPHVEGCS